MEPAESVMEIEMPAPTTQTSPQPRRIEPIFDASGALRRVPGSRPASKETVGRPGTDRD